MLLIQQIGIIVLALNKLDIEVIKLYCQPNGNFPCPEPLKNNLKFVK